MKNWNFNFCYTCLLLLLAFNLNAQDGIIRGQITSAEGALAFVNVILNNASDSSIAKVEVSDEQGLFVFKGLQQGSYFLEASFVGMTAYTSELLKVGTEPVVLKPIVLESSSAEIGEVEVVAKRPMIEVLADKTVFNVENSLNSTGTNGFELLRKAPGVIVDNNNNLIVDGKTGVQIFINGKLSILAGDDLVNYLESLQSTDIEAIEIITQPSSRYDAAGNAGIINIKLKKDKRLGTNGTIVSGFTQGRNARYNNSLSLNNRGKNTNLFGTYSNNFGESWSFINLDRTQSGVRYDSRSESISDNSANNIKLGFDYTPNNRHTVGVLFNGNFFNRELNGFTNTPIIPFNSGVLEETLVANSEEQSDNYNLFGNVNYRFADTLGHELTVDFDYGVYSRDRTSYQPNQYINAQTGAVRLERNFRMITPTNIDIFTFKADYSQNFLGGKLSIGGKYSYISTDNDFRFFDVVDGEDFFNTDRSNQFTYTENINAGYFNFNKKWQKWNLQVGLRAEQTISEGDLTSTQDSEEDNVKRNYLDWFPSGGLTFNPNRNSSWALTYSRRIQRPNYQSLNPFESQLDELSFSKGNPFLQPQYTENVKLSHTYKYRLTTSISYSRIQDFFAQVTDTLGATRNFLITRNIANQDVVSLGISYPFNVNKWWSVFFSLNAYHSSYSGNDERFVAIDQSTLSLYAQNSFTLPAGFRFEISGWYNSPSIWGGTYLTRSMGSLDLALQKKFLNDKLSVRLSFTDILFTSPWKADMRFGDLYIDGSGGWESRQARINLSYAFGNQNVKNSRKRKTGLDDESKRVSN